MLDYSTLGALLVLAITYLILIKYLKYLRKKIKTAPMVIKELIKGLDDGTIKLDKRQ